MVTQLSIYGMGYKYNKPRALKLWQGRLQELQARGNCKGNGPEDFFSEKMSDSERLAYIQKMIDVNR